MTSRTRTTQVRLDRATADRLRDIAHDLGFVQRFGPLVGEGSTVQMLEALARGELVIRTLQNDDTSNTAIRPDRLS